MELNTQRTVSGLALLPRLAGDSGWERPHMALPGEPLAQHRPGCPPPTPPLPLAAPHSSACSPPCAAASLDCSGPRDPLCIVHQQPESPRRGPSRAPVHRFLKNTHSRQTCKESAHDSAPRILCSHRHTLQTPPVLFAFVETVVLEKAQTAAVATQAQRQPCAVVCL